MGEIILNEHHLLPPELATVATHFFAAHPVPVPPVCVCVEQRRDKWHDHKATPAFVILACNVLRVS